MTPGSELSETEAIYGVVAALSPRSRHPGVIELLPGHVVRYRLLQFTKTGEHREEAIAVAAQMFTIRKAYSVLRPGPTFNTVAEVYRHVTPAIEALDNYPSAGELEWERHQHEHALRAWPPTVRAIATDIAEEIADQATVILRSTPDWPEARCAACAGSGHRQMACACVFFGPAGVTDLDQPPPVEPEPAGFLPDPDCTACAGAGSTDGECLDCSCTGVLPAPITSVVTIAGGDTVTIHASPSGLASRTPATVRLTWEPRRLIVTWALSEQPLIADAADRAGIALASSLTRSGKSINDLPPWLSGTARHIITIDTAVEVDRTAPGWWREQLPDAHNVAALIADELHATTGVLLPSPEPAHRIAHADAADIQLDERRVVTGRHISVRPQLATADLLTELAAAATTSGHTAAITTGYSFTEEYGPQVVLLDENLEIAKAFRPHFCVEHALLRLPRLANSSQ